jgi:hypothetical protein
MLIKLKLFLITLIIVTGVPLHIKSIVPSTRIELTIDLKSNKETYKRTEILNIKKKENNITYAHIITKVSKNLKTHEYKGFNTKGYITIDTQNPNSFELKWINPKDFSSDEASKIFQELKNEYNKQQDSY